MWEEKCTQEKHHTPRRRWTTISTITILLLCTLGLLLHFMIARQGHPTQVAPSPARLRPEEDYILDPQWDFDAQPQSREYSWTIRDHELNPDGVYRPMILINGMFPGPLIECNEGDELVVHVHNRATNATSIHWHGLYQNGTNYMDGTVGVTQCPIAPGHSFTYRFNVTGQSGTYYYHSHVSMQASDGLVGPMIIHTRDGGEKELQMITYEQDRIVMLSDHYYDLSSDLLMQYLAPGSENDEPVPPSALINGRNIRHCPDFPNRNCSADNLSRARFNLSATSNTRLRILNVGAFAEFSLQIDEHEFQVTEVDGTDVHPQSIHRLNINPAQRYSIIVSPPKDSNKSLYWMRARMITHCFAYENPELQEEVWGVINYPSSSNNHSASLDQLPQTKDWTETIEVECRDLNTTLLTPIIPVSFPTSFEHSLYLRSSFQIRDWALSRGYLNDSSFRINATQPILTTLLDAYSDTDVADIPQGVNDNLFDKSKQLVYQTTGTPYISILVQNFDDGTHPFHLHGYKFAVLAQGHGYPPKELLSTLTATNPLRRDTASVEAFGWMLVAFRADNPGVWAWHCHLGWHNEAGLGMVFATRMEQMAGWEGRKEVKQLRGLCGVDGVEKGMGPDDGEWAGEIQDD
ncbi:multicopper oxidase-domain-containing protein [Phaeosphaeria sp. MPI-PUGE-AT-0046c]|nr:multicopper oxidase-domain-containing protein [Phaeosphaeria sp. MPI-PUGE-AT-0046c]